MANAYKEYPNREEWLKGRLNSIGASEVASVLGLGFQTPEELWEVKTRRGAPKDLSENERVSYGTEAEAYLRALFALKSKNIYKVEYFPYRVYYHRNLPYLTATLDGELIRVGDNAKGIWECKTVRVTSSKVLEEWEGRLPMKYYCQVLEQLNVTGFEFAVVTVELVYPSGNSEIRNIPIEKTEQISSDMKYLEKEVVKFWTEYVSRDKRPPAKLTL